MDQPMSYTMYNFVLVWIDPFVLSRDIYPFFVLSIEIFLLSTHLSIEIFMHVIGEDKQTDKGLSVSGWELIETK